METTQNTPLALIIEDNDSLSDIFSQAMKIAGFEIQTVANGLEAIDILSNHEPSVIILDLYLPGISGEKILTYIRNENRLNNVIIVLTTFDSFLAEKYRELSDFVLLKPVSFSQLRDLGIRLSGTIN